MSLLDEEEQEIEFQYREQKEYAIGHGSGVNWELGEKDVLIKTDPIPSMEIPQITTSFDSSQALALDYLARATGNKDETVDELTEFVQNYEKWIEEQEQRVALFPEKAGEVGARITGRMRRAKDRMRSGVQILREDDKALRAFSLANRAILDQMAQTDKQKNKAAKEPYAWRPFQLAFLLTVLESATNDNSKYRDLVDLIWFPTGGGKTEAYFGLIAYVILLRRLKYPATSGGTTALMRYTLRLLTKDQYLRAARLICALELIRREQSDCLGQEPVSVGQDLLNYESIGTIDSFLVGGLEQGRWCFFHDSNNQAGVLGSFDPDALRYLTELNPISVPLKTNCRNTSPILKKIQSTLNVDMGNDSVGKGPEVLEKHVADDETVSDVLQREIKPLLSDGSFTVDQIIVLSPNSFRNSGAFGLRSAPRFRVTEMDSFSPGTARDSIGFATIADFKGLESEIVFLIDMPEPGSNPELRSLQYIGMSRARALLYMIH